MALANDRRAAHTCWPLPSDLVEILRSLPSRENSKWVFPDCGSTGHLADPKKAWLRIRERAGERDVRVRDLSRTLGCWVSGQGYTLQLIGRALNHSSTLITQVHARLDLDPVREPLERNAQLMHRGARDSEQGTTESPSAPGRGTVTRRLS